MIKTFRNLTSEFGHGLGTPMCGVITIQIAKPQSTEYIDKTYARSVPK